MSRPADLVGTGTDRRRLSQQRRHKLLGPTDTAARHSLRQHPRCYHSSFPGTFFFVLRVRLSARISIPFPSFFLLLLSFLFPSFSSVFSFFSSLLLLLSLLLH